MTDTPLEAVIDQAKILTKASEHLIQAGEVQATLTDLIEAFAAQHDKMLHLIDPSMERCGCDLCVLSREVLATIAEGQR
jgi:hypothetical protein